MKVRSVKAERGLSAQSSNMAEYAFLAASVIESDRGEKEGQGNSEMPGTLVLKHLPGDIAISSAQARLRWPAHRNSRIVHILVEEGHYRTTQRSSRSNT